MAKRIEKDQSDFISTILYYGDDRITEQEFREEMERFRGGPKIKKVPQFFHSYKEPYYETVFEEHKVQKQDPTQIRNSAFSSFMRH